MDYFTSQVLCLSEDVKRRGRLCETMEVVSLDT